MTLTRYVALLRGINVGGSNVIRMADLKACFEDQGLEAVRTYIASGNVLFATGRPAPAVTRRLEEALSDRFDYQATLVLRSLAELRTVVRRAPKGCGTLPATYRYDVIFLRKPLTARSVVGSVPRREGVDQAHAGPGVLYFSRLVARAAQSRLSRLIAMPEYQSMTIRNWNTTTKLLELMQAG